MPGLGDLVDLKNGPFEVLLANLDAPSKAALRLCNKKIKARIDATVKSCTVGLGVLGRLLRCDWDLETLIFSDASDIYEFDEATTDLFAAVCSKFRTLTTLEFSHVPLLAALPTNIGILSSLKELKIERAFLLTTLPSSFSQLTALESLTFSLCESLTLEGLAPIEHLKQLKLLDMNETPFTEVPEFICSLSLLQTLRLRPLGGWSPDPDLIFLPDPFSKLGLLEELEILADVDCIAPLEHLTGLTKLVLDGPDNIPIEIRGPNRELVHYPDFLWNLTSLRMLKLSDTAVASLPDAIGNLKRLTCLHIDNLRAGQLPESIGNLSDLNELYIERIDVTRLPESLGNLTAIRSMKISGCRYLETLPLSIGNLKQLEKFIIYSCWRFSHLPPSFQDLSSLRSLKIQQCNEFMEPDFSVKDMSTITKLEIYDCRNCAITEYW